MVLQPSLFDDNLPAIGVPNILAGPFAPEKDLIEFLKITFAFYDDFFSVIKIAQQVLGCVTERFEQQRYRKFAAAIDADIHDILGVDFHIDPGAAYRYDA